MNQHTQPQDAADVVAGNFQFQAQLPNGKAFSVSCYVFKDEDEDSLNARVDLVARVIERQRMIAEIPELESKLDQMEDARRQVETIIEDISGKDKPSSQERNQLNTMRVNLRKIDADIAKGKEAIGAARDKLKKAA